VRVFLKDQPRPKSVFLSYCWVNSELATKAGQARRIEGAIGNGDPRELKTFLESNGFSCWIDIDQVGRVSKFFVIFCQLSCSVVHQQVD
jgi:hypothetical protein